MGVGVAITFSFYVFVSNKVNLNLGHNFTSLVKSLAFSRYLLRLLGLNTQIYKRIKHSQMA